ncbi:MAG: hypothetical protein ABI837_08465 [Acidobacteriota bacterium]
MIRRDIHDVHDFFEYVRLGVVPAADPARVDVAVLDMNHSWPNMGHDSLVHIVLELAEDYRDVLVEAGMKVRVISFDVRRALQIPEPPDRFRIYLGTGGPGHLESRLNDGVSEFSQGIDETSEWEAPLFHLFDRILADGDASLFGVCHSYGLMCRWSGAARAELRALKSSGMHTNTLTPAALEHPWFSQFANALPDHLHYRVIDNRLFDLVLEAKGGALPLAYENDRNVDGITMIEFARDKDGHMPRILGVNHHPEIIDREHLLGVLDGKRAHGEVSEQWYQERLHTLETEMLGEGARQSRLTSHFTLIAPLRYQLAKLIGQRREELGLPAEVAAASR